MNFRVCFLSCGMHPLTFSVCTAGHRDSPHACHACPRHYMNHLSPLSWCHTHNLSPPRGLAFSCVHNSRCRSLHGCRCLQRSSLRVHLPCPSPTATTTRSSLCSARAHTPNSMKRQSQKTSTSQTPSELQKGRTKFEKPFRWHQERYTC